MRVTYDPAKSQRNEKDRGLPFALAKDFDWSCALVVEDTREDYNERRYQALGYMTNTCTCWCSLRETARSM